MGTVSKPVKAAIYTICLVLSVSLFALIAPADDIEVLKQKFYTFLNENPATTLYLHLDKNNYTPQETIWFKAYVLAGEVTDNKVLYVRLTDSKRKIVSEDRFPMHGLIGHGDLLLPDSLKEGSYYLYAYTDRMLNFNQKDVFVQAIKLRANMAKRLETEASVTDTSMLKRGQKVQVLIKVKEGTDLLKGVRGEYSLETDTKTFPGGKIATNLFGEATVTFTYPNIPDDESLRLTVKFKRENDFADMVLNLKHEGTPLKIKIYPESGALLTGIHNRLCAQLLDVKGNPVETTLQLKDGSAVLAEVKTNRHGMALFTIKPQQTGRYSIHQKGLANKELTNLQEFIQTDGYGIQLNRRGKQTELMLYNRGQAGDAMLLLRSAENVLWNKVMHVNAGDSLLVPLALHNFPDGILSLAVFGPDGKPKAERLFFNKAAAGYLVNIKTDEQVYGTRKKVTVTLSITDKDGKPVPANLSVAAAETSRLERALYRDIVSYCNARGTAGINEALYTSGASEKEYDAILMGAKWWNTWDNITAYQPRGTIKLLKYADGISGVVTVKKKKTELPKELFMMLGKVFYSIPLSKEGLFYIPSESMITERGEKRYLFLNEDFHNKYSISMHNYQQAFDEAVTYGKILFIPQSFNAFVKHEPEKLVSLKGALTMNAVTITTKQSTEALLDKGIFKSVDCNDRICMYNILNCTNHVGCCAMPVEGQTYSYRGKPVVYQGCGTRLDAGNLRLTTISLPGRFFLQDYDKQPSSELEYRSTVFWQPNINTSKEGIATFSFFTNDVKGSFYIMAQGMDFRNGQPVYGKTEFAVK